MIASTLARNVAIRSILLEMKLLELQPNLAVYNIMLEAMDKAGKLGLARCLFYLNIESSRREG